MRGDRVTAGVEVGQHTNGRGCCVTCLRTCANNSATTIASTSARRDSIQCVEPAAETSGETPLVVRRLRGRGNGLIYAGGAQIRVYVLIV